MNKMQLVEKRSELEFVSWVVSGHRTPDQKQATIKQLRNIYKTSTVATLKDDIEKLESKYSFFIEVA